MKRLVAFVGTFFILTAAAQTPQRGLLSIHADELREKVTYLASKEMKGRGDGAPELRLAADYIAGMFRKNGIKPAGDAGTYYQNFRMFTARLGSGNAFRVGSSEYILATDYVPHFLSPAAEVEGPLVFVGYGVSAPSLKFDELAGVNLRGRVAVVLDANPHAENFASDFNRVDLTEKGSILTKARNVARAGAVGLVVLQNPNIPNISIADSAATFRSDYPRRDVPMGDQEDVRNPRIPVVILSESAARRLIPSLRDLQRSIDVTLKPQFLDLGKRATLKVDVQRISFATQNVLGLIEGSDSRLRREVLIVGAHYDHDGESGGQIWPGADDNASGTSGVLELAEAFGTGSMVPARSILLCAFAGEEKGEIGSQHYADHPAIPIDRTVAMLQMDMIGRNEEHPANHDLHLDREIASQNANSVNLVGSIFSLDLRRIMEEANRGIGLELKFRYDDTPENLLRRSDQWAFLQKGVPALFIHTGEHPDYHRPSDTADKINYPKMEKIVRLVFVAVEAMANAEARPAYLPAPY
jgi:Peptidase family M28/PA domain